VVSVVGPTINGSGGQNERLRPLYLALPAISISLPVTLLPWPLPLLRELVCVALLLVGLKTSRMLYGTVASPLGLFTIAWEGGLALANLRLIEYTLPSSHGEFMLQGSYMVVLLCSIIVGVPRTTPHHYTGSPIVTDWLGRALLVLGVTGILLGLWRLSQSLGLLAIMSHPTEVRLARIGRDFDSGLTGNLRTFLLPAAFIVRPGSMEAYVLVALTAIWALLSTERLLLPLVALCLLVGFLYRAGSRIQWSQLQLFVALAGLSLLVFIVGGGLLGKDEAVAKQVETATGSQPIIPSVLVSPYVYATASFAAFGQYVDQERPATVGVAAVVTPIGRLSGQRADIFYEFRGVPFDVNIYTYLRSWYDAFGEVGTLIGPAMYSLIAAAAYCRRQRSIGWYLLSGIVTVGMVGGIINPYLTYIDFVALGGASLALALLGGPSRQLGSEYGPTVALSTSKADDRRR
jgi:oligosaccharide repeat unit polymerase